MRSGIWKIAAVLLVLAAAVYGWGFVNAQIVRVRFCELRLRDLPRPFEQTRILYAADIDLCGRDSGEKAAALFRHLDETAPDLVLLGGDYMTEPLFGKRVDALYELDRFFSAFEGYRPKLGIYGILSAEESDYDELRALMRRYGIVPMYNNVKTLEKDGERLLLLGFGDSFTSPKSGFAASDCVIGFAHDSGDAASLCVDEAQGGGALLDALLTGGADAQVRLPFLRGKARFRTGWQTAGDTNLLITTGVGCERLDFRLGTQGEVWLITLTGM